MVEAQPWVIALIVGIAAPAFGFLGNLLAEWLRKAKTNAEARAAEGDYTQKIGMTYKELVDTLMEQVAEMTKKQDAFDLERAAERKELVELRAEVLVLREKVRTMSKTIARLEMELARYRPELENHL